MKSVLVVAAGLLGLGTAVLVHGLPDSGTDRTAPHVTLLAPTRPTVARGPVTFLAEADDAGTGVVLVDFFVDGDWITRVEHEPWRARWDDALDHPGAHVVQAKAVDAAGNVRYSATGEVLVADVEAPTVWITEVDDEPGSVTVSVGAADNVAVDRVEVFAGDELVGRDGKAPFVVVADAGSVAGRPLKAKAVDPSGNVRYSAGY